MVEKLLKLRLKKYEIILASIDDSVMHYKFEFSNCNRFDTQV